MWPFLNPMPSIDPPTGRCKHNLPPEPGGGLEAPFKPKTLRTYNLEKLDPAAIQEMLNLLPALQRLQESSFRSSTERRMEAMYVTTALYYACHLLSTVEGTNYESI